MPYAIDITHNDNKTVTIRLVNTVYDWSKPSSFLPKLENCAHPTLCIGLEGTDPVYLTHSVFTASDSTHETSCQKNLHLSRQAICRTV
jgi:hypothetical protein